LIVVILIIRYRQPSYTTKSRISLIVLYSWCITSALLLRDPVGVRSGDVTLDEFTPPSLQPPKRKKKLK
jgi:hypothetical protein